MILRQGARMRPRPLLRQWAADASLCDIAEFSKLGEMNICSFQGH